MRLAAGIMDFVLISEKRIENKIHVTDENLLRRAVELNTQIRRRLRHFEDLQEFDRFIYQNVNECR